MATKKENFEAIRNYVAEREDLVDFINHEIELLDKRNSGERKPTKTQIENDQYKNEVLAFILAENKPLTITDIQAGVESIAGLSNQRVSRAIMKPLVDSKFVVRSKIKGVTYYTSA